MKPSLKCPWASPRSPPSTSRTFRAWIAAGAPDDTPAEAQTTDKAIVYLQPSVVNALAFSPDGKSLAVSGNREILIHSLDAQAAPIRLAGLSERILSLAYSSDGATLVTAGGTPARFGEIQIWDLKTSKLRRSITVTGDTVFGASLTPDGSRIAVGCTDNTVRIFDAQTGKELFKIGNHARWALGDPIWPKTAMAFGGKFGIDDDTETPNTLTAGFSYGEQELVVEVRGKMTNGEGVRQARVVTAGPGARGPAPAAAPPAAPAPTQVGPASNPLNVGVGDLFYGSDGWAAMSDTGFQAYKGDSSELIMEERPDRSAGDPPPCT